MSTRTVTGNGQQRTGARPGNIAAARSALDVMLTDVPVGESRTSRFFDPDVHAT